MAVPHQTLKTDRVFKLKKLVHILSPLAGIESLLKRQEAVFTKDVFFQYVLRKSDIIC